jgi:hypothetical protein
MAMTQLDRGKLAVRTSLVFVAGGIVTACCPAPPAPQPVVGCPRASAPSTPTELEACLRGFTFDTDYEVSDEQPLTVMGDSLAPPCPGDETKTRTCRYGPLAKIAPLIGAQNYGEKDLREGRFIARLSIPGSETEGYPKYGLQPGSLTYWWVQTDSTGTGGVSVFVTMTKDGEISSVRRPLTRERYQDKEYKKGTKGSRASARWIWTLDDETAKGPCGSATCK